MENRRSTLFGNAKPTANTRSTSPLSALTAEMQELLAEYKADQPSQHTLHREFVERAAASESIDCFSSLGLRLADIFVMLESVPSAMDSTLKLLTAMADLATEALNGTNSQADLDELNEILNTYKTIMPYLQMVETNNGFKTLSGGDITIGFSNNNSLKIPLDAFDIDSLDLADCDISSVSAAGKALRKINDAIEFVSAIDAAIKLRIDTTVTSLLTIPARLKYAYATFDYMRNLAIKALNGTGSFADLQELNQYYKFAIDAINLNHLITTVNGKLLMGDGDLTIQIGANATPDNTLKFALPVTGAKKLGLDQLDISRDAKLAFQILTKAKNSMAYDNAIRSAQPVLNIVEEMPAPKSHRPK